MKLAIPKNSWKKIVALIILLAVAMIFPYMPISAYFVHIMVITFQYAFLALVWNLVMRSGQMLFGQTIFYGLGAYTSTILFERFWLSPWIGIFIGGIVALVFAVIIGWPTFRVGLRGAYFSMATLAINAIFFYVVIAVPEITGGALGLSLTHSFSIINMQFVTREPYYFISLGMLLTSILIIHMISRTKFGLYIKAIREDEDAAMSLGINITLYKTLTLCVCAFLSAMAGTFYTQYVYYIDPPTTFNLLLNFEVIGYAVIGGIGTVFGPIIGAFIVRPLAEYLRISIGAGLPGLHLAVYGIILIVVIMFLPGGIYGLLKKAYGQFTKGAK